jgi:hypothetical protein
LVKIADAVPLELLGIHNYQTVLAAAEIFQELLTSDRAGTIPRMLISSGLVRSVLHAFSTTAAQIPETKRALLLLGLITASAVKETSTEKDN